MALKLKRAGRDSMQPWSITSIPPKSLPCAPQHQISAAKPPAIEHISFPASTTSNVKNPRTGYLLVLPQLKAHPICKGMGRVEKPAAKLSRQQEKPRGKHTAAQEPSPWKLKSEPDEPIHAANLVTARRPPAEKRRPLPETVEGRGLGNPEWWWRFIIGTHPPFPR